MCERKIRSVFSLLFIDEVLQEFSKAFKGLLSKHFLGWGVYTSIRTSHQHVGQHSLYQKLGRVGLHIRECLWFNLNQNTLPTLSLSLCVWRVKFTWDSFQELSNSFQMTIVVFHSLSEWLCSNSHESMNEGKSSNFLSIASRLFLSWHDAPRFQELRRRCTVHLHLFFCFRKKFMIFHEMSPFIFLFLWHFRDASFSDYFLVRTAHFDRKVDVDCGKGTRSEGEWGEKGLRLFASCRASQHSKLIAALRLVWQMNHASWKAWGKRREEDLKHSRENQTHMIEINNSC